MPAAIRRVSAETLGRTVADRGAVSRSVWCGSSGMRWRVARTDVHEREPAERAALAVYLADFQPPRPESR
jgi:hypothetical protein